MGYRNAEERDIYLAYYRTVAAEKVAANKKKYYETDKGKACRRREIQKIQAKRLTVGGRVTNMFNSARRRGYECTITKEWLMDRVERGRCEITGLEFDKNGGPFGASIDRIDNEKGYTPENCRVICWGLNRAFGIWGEDFFKVIATAYVARR